MAKWEASRQRIKIGVRIERASVRIERAHRTRVEARY